MHIKKTIRSRDEMIKTGNEVGRVLMDAALQRPWIVTLGGDVKSGKSLLAFAMDQVFLPERYARGIIPQDYCADDILCPDEGEYLPVVFTNFGPLVLPTQKTFDEHLDNFALTYRSAKVIILSSLKRTLTGHFNYSAKGMMSDRLDLNIDCFIRDGVFTRDIEVSFDNPQLNGLASLAR